MTRVCELDSYLLEYIRDLIYGDYVLSRHYPHIEHDSEPIPAGDEILYAKTAITINTQITKHELIQYFERNWIDISRVINKLTPKPSYYISKRDLRIIMLKDDEGLAFREIANRIVKDLAFDDVEAKINVLST